MKKHTLFIVLAITSISIIIAQITACNSAGNAVPATTSTKIDIPDLMMRKGTLAQADDWATVQMEVGKLREKITQNPDDYKSMLYLAAVFMQEARTTGEHPYYYPAALKVLDQLLAQNPKDPDMVLQALTSKASICLSQHDFQQALALGKQALAMNDRFSAVYGVLIDANVELGHYAEAVKMSDKMSGIRPDLRSYSRISYLRELHGDYKGAVKAMKLAISAGVPGAENTEWCRFTLGELYRHHNDLKNAELQYQTSLNLRPSYAFAKNGLAEVENERGHYDKAIALSQEAAAVMPEFSFYETQARAYQHKQQPEKVKELTADLLRMMEEDRASGHNVALEIAKIQLRLANDPTKALEAAQAEYQKRPDNISVNQVMAEIALASNDKVSAKKYLAVATRTGYTNTEIKILSDKLSK